MEFLFVDESGDANHKDYLGLCVAAVNSSHYKTIKTGFQDVLRGSSWDESIEFKGSHLFSASSGDASVTIDERIEIAQKVLALNSSDKNARFRFHFSRKKEAGNLKDAYLDTLPKLIKKALKKPPKKNGKDVVAVWCDFRSDVNAAEIQAAIMPILAERGYTLLESVTLQHSDFHTVGVLYADIVCYLASRVDIIQNDLGLFEDVTEAQVQASGKLKKLKSSSELIELIKKLDTHELK